MPKFAHMSDLHIGAFRQPELRALISAAFDSAVDRCVKEKVDFVIMAGDIFDSNIPDLGAVRRAAEKMREAADQGIRFYAIYGSHDFSPNYSSIVDVLGGAGLFRRVELKDSSSGRVSLRLVDDPSGARICGISGKRQSVDREEYAMLDRQALEKEPGFKIFVFHGGIDELKPSSLEMMDTMPASYLPSGFGYYAGGHIHSRGISSLPGRKNIAYPGPLFATDYSELTQLARGERRGFYIVEFGGDGVTDARFMPVGVCDVVEIHYSADGRASSQVTRELLDAAEAVDINGRVVLLTVDGRLRQGKTSDINFQSIQKRLLSLGPLVVLSNYSRLTSVEMTAALAHSKGPRLVERELIERRISAVRTEVSELRGEKGVAVAVDLLRTLKTARKENETKGDFEERTVEAGLDVLGLGET